MSLSKKIRFDVFKRDGFQCQYCGMSPPAVILEIDHIHPLSKGGSDLEDNLITSCFDCNRGKAAGLLSVAPQNVINKAQILAEKMEQLKAFERLQRAKRKREDKCIDAVESIYSDNFDGYIFKDHFRETVRRFLQQLSVFVLTDAMNIACSKIHDEQKVLRYFCGICWRKINAE